MAEITYPITVSEMRERYLKLYSGAVNDVLRFDYKMHAALPSSYIPLRENMKLCGQAFTLKGAPDITTDGEFEMRAEEELRRDPAFLAWDNEHIATNICPGGESFGGVQSRALAAIAPLLAVGEDAVCVIHGGVIACMMTHWFPGGGFARWMPHPGTGWCVTVEDGKPVSYIAIPEE